MTEALQQEIRTLRSLHNSERDPEGRVFAPLADAYRRAGQIPEAVRLLNDGLTRLPDFVPGHVVAAQLYVEQGLAEEAGLAARRALELDPDNVQALRSLLHVLQDRGEAREASRVRDHLIALEPDFAAEPAAAATPIAADGGAPPAASDLEDAWVLDAVGEAHEEAQQEAPGAFAEDALDLGTTWDLTLEPEPGSGLGEPSGTSALEELEQPVAPAFGTPEPPEEEHVFDLDALAPVEGEAAGDEAVDFGLLAAEEPEAPAIDMGSIPEAEPVFDLGALAPDEPEEPVLDLAALAPDEPEEPVLDVAALAPDEVVLDVAALAPDEPEEPVLDVAALAPDEPEEVVLNVAALAPDEPEEPVLDVAALAPDEPEEPVVDMAALAPDEPEEAVLDMAALAPGEPEEPVIDLDELAPDALPGLGPREEGAVDIAFLSPGASDPDDVVIDLDALRPDRLDTETGEEAPLEPPGVPALGGGVSDLPVIAAAEDEEPSGVDANEEEGDTVRDGAEEGGADEGAEDGEPVYSRTLAELYVKQGAVGRALRVLRHLQAADPGNRELADRIAELEAGGEPPAPAPVEEAAADRRGWRPDDEGDEHREADEDKDQELESLARDLAGSGDEVLDVESPFSWGEREAEPPAEGPPIGDYFEGLLSWEPGEDR